MHLFPLATTAECVTMPRYRTPSTSKLRAEQSRCCRPPAPHHCSWPRDAAGLQTPTMPSEPSSLPRNHLPRRDTLPAGSISPPGDPTAEQKRTFRGQRGPRGHRPLSAAAGSPALLLPAAQRPVGRAVSPNFTPAAAFERAARASAAEPAAPRGGAGSGGRAALQEAGSERGGKAASPALRPASRCPRPAGWRPRWSCPWGPLRVRRR